MNWNNKENKNLIQAILAIDTPEEAKDFLCDILTEKEIMEISKRLLAAEMLLQNVQYLAVEEKTGFSSTTIARVSRCLKTGKGGYKNILSKLHHQDSTQLRRGLS